MVLNRCWRVLLGLGSPRDKHDANRLLNALEDARVDLGLMTFGGAVNDPDRIRRAAERIPHLLERRPVEETGDGVRVPGQGNRQLIHVAACAA